MALTQNGVKNFTVHIFDIGESQVTGLLQRSFRWSGSQKPKALFPRLLGLVFDPDGFDVGELADSVRP
jgi:hypothetical protein